VDSPEGLSSGLSVPSTVPLVGGAGGDGGTGGSGFSSTEPGQAVRSESPRTALKNLKQNPPAFSERVERGAGMVIASTGRPATQSRPAGGLAATYAEEPLTFF
jgi:hypothetical protein